MKTRTMLLTLVTFVGVAVMCLAVDDANMGTWKLNEAKSKPAAGMGKNNMVSYEAAGDSIKVTIDGVDGTGKATHNEWTGKFDGKDYPVSGDPTSDMRSYKRVNSHTLAFAAKKDGKVTISGQIVVSADGKTRSVTATMTDSKGVKHTTTGTYDKQ